MKLRTILPLLGFVMVTLLFWAAGFDFNERGDRLFWYLVISFICCPIAYMLGNDIDKERF